MRKIYSVLNMTESDSDELYNVFTEINFHSSLRNMRRKLCNKLINLHQKLRQSMSSEWLLTNSHALDCTLTTSVNVLYEDLVCSCIPEGYIVKEDTLLCSHRVMTEHATQYTFNQEMYKKGCVAALLPGYYPQEE